VVQLLARVPDFWKLLLQEGSVHSCNSYVLDLRSHADRGIACFLLEGNRLMRRRLQLHGCTPAWLHALYPYLAACTVPLPGCMHCTPTWLHAPCAHHVRQYLQLCACDLPTCVCSLLALRTHHPPTACTQLSTA
jgi:hypothetical protein